jgi:drug/metabolite transporter (DMT)-like permease
MIGVVGGTLAALLWGTSGFAAARSSRAVGAESALAWVYVVGLCVALPLALSTGLPHPSGEGMAWMAVAGVAGVASLYLMYAALGRGPVVLVMPLAGAQGGVAALAALAAGERLEPLATIALAIVLVGMVAAMWPPAARARAPHATAAVVLAALSAATAGLALFATPRAAHSLGTPWVLGMLRSAGVLGLTLPLAASGRLRPPRDARRFVVFSGLADTGAFGSYIYAASRSGVAVPAVIASQYAAISAVLGVIALGERPTRVQLSGVVGILAGVALVTAVQS